MEELKADYDPISPNNEKSSKQQETIDVMGKILEHDAEIRRNILDIYESVVAMFEMENFEKNLRKELATEYGEYNKRVESNMDHLRRKHCPIVVAGETSSGKSSLLNLIIGERVLPEHLLSSTACICQIYNSVKKQAIAIDEKGNRTSIDEVTDDKLIKYVCVKKSSQNTQSSCSKRVDIFWPLPMLKEHAIIIDTPGVGDSDEMTTKLLDYLTEAVAFIYVINTPNAGGVQDDRLGKILRKQRDLEEKGSLKQFDPGCAIFVCNKWDQVSEKEEQDVWLDIAEKLKANWPTSKDNDLEAQMFKMSVKTELERSEKGLDCTEKLKSLISGIDRLVSACLERRVTKHINWLQEFLDKLLVNVIANINSSRKNQEEKNKMKIEVEMRLKFLENETETVKTNMNKEAEEMFKNIAKQITEHLQKEQIKKKMFTWCEDDFPDGDYLCDINKRAEELIQEKIHLEIVNWCYEQNIERKSNQLFEKFIDNCKIIKRTFSEIDQIFKGNNAPIKDKNIRQGEETSSDFDCRRRGFGVYDSYRSFTFISIRIALYILETLRAIPDVVRKVAEKIKESEKIKLYRKNKQSYILKMAEEEIKTYSQNVVFQFLCSGYLRSLKTSFETVCEDIIPKQIKADQELIERLLTETRDSETLKQEYAPIEEKCKNIIGHLLYANIKYLSDCPPSVLKEKDILGRGSFAIVYLCDVENCGTMSECAVKQMLSPIELDSYLQLSEASYLRKFQHPNIVQCYGVSIETKDDQKEYLNIFMEHCDCSLADVLLCNNHRMDMCECNKHRKKSCGMFKEEDTIGQEYRDALIFFLKTIQDIVNGLDFLHYDGFVHRDLNLSNILIKGDTAKISDVGTLKRQSQICGTIIGTPLYMAPEASSGQIYGLPADIYSLAIVMWEMWYGRKMTINVNFKATLVPPEQIQRMIKDCWVEEADGRPTARQLKTRLKEIDVA